jgi:hypothetical protein
MRTTLTIDDDLLEQAKRQALELGVTVSEVVNRQLRRGLAQPSLSQTRPATITAGQAGGPPVDWDDVARRLDAEEFEWLRRKSAL